MAHGSIASADLQWLLIRKGNSFTSRQYGTERVFSAEKGNLRNIHAFKYSGLVNDRIIDVSAHSSGSGLTVTIRDPKAARFAVSKANKSQRIKGSSGRKAAGAVAKVSDSEAGRHDLHKSALARASAVLASQRPAKEQRERHQRGAPKARKAGRGKKAEEDVPELVSA